MKETRPTLSQIVRKYGDFTGDGIIDAFYIYPYKAGSGDEFQIYTYKNGKTIRLLRDGGYGLAKFTFYKKSKSLIMNQYGHGGEAYRYYKMIGGVYNEVASKGRRSTSGGSNHNGSWEYSTGNGLSYRTLTKSQFQSIIKGLKKGKKVILSFE